MGSWRKPRNFAGRQIRGRSWCVFIIIRHARAVAADYEQPGNSILSHPRTRMIQITMRSFNAMIIDGSNLALRGVLSPRPCPIQL
ncbi:uncharacterized protein GGS22DRAFT_47515 [Annulohypoxylon maeteangense]|uniref:uncharacterized protein n=1 Tax=Annulohypoxylon maeteangense TaxID=1927788 RepID=UPI00200794FC|nr:uncharacterized protein GGS22DRAFT_47515 [Annulohypoxylon maeteangense]KAI0882655.1 hypothetical protein GGS22DRAFT_47515 [Annulohypoxylon maeteangense]